MKNVLEFAKKINAEVDGSPAVTVGYDPASKAAISILVAWQNGFFYKQFYTHDEIESNLMDDVLVDALIDAANFHFNASH